MASGGEEDKAESNDFYQVLGLDKECTATELKNAYKKLALRWHPDRCSGSGNSSFAEEAKKKFQAIQEAYSVLSDTNKRFLYDVGVYDSDDDESGQGQGMGDFLNEMAVMRSQTNPNETVEESFEELQELFDEMFQEDLGMACRATTAASCSTTYVSYSESTNSNNKRVSTEMNLGNTKLDDSSGFNSHFENFCVGAEHRQDFKQGRGVRRGLLVTRRQGGKQKV